jgi:hypothetical protein
VRRIPGIPHVPGRADHARVLTTDEKRDDVNSLLHNPRADYLRALTGIRITRFRQACGRKDVGASAIELAIITAVIVGLAIVVLLIVTNVVNNRANEINTNNGLIP